jgi:hypothetical protein
VFETQSEDFERTYFLKPPDTTPRCLVILGTSRGGTSFYAAVARVLGIHMGTDLAGNHEDPAFHNCFYPDFSRDRFAAIVARRSQDGGVWGFKLPKASLFIDRFDDLLPDPMYLIAVRNPLSAALSERHRGGDFHNTFRYSLHFYQQVEKYFREHDRPALFSVYERAASDPVRCLRMLGQIMGLAVTAEMERAVLEVAPGDGGGYVRF